MTRPATTLLLLALSVAPAAAKSPEYPPLPLAVSSFGAAVSDGWLYIYGGHCGKTHQYSTEAVSGQFLRLKLDGGAKWEELTGGPGLQGLALVAHKGKVYRLGGMQPRNKPGDPADNHSLAECVCYDPATKKWEKLPDLPEPRSSHDAVVLGDRIFVVGGWKLGGAGTRGEWITTAATLDLSRKSLKWESIEQPFKRRALTAAAYQGKVYVLGGLGADGQALDVNVYDPKKKAWSKAPAIPGAPRNGFTPASCVADRRLFLSPADGKLLRLSEKEDAWEEVGQLKQPRVVHRLAAAGDNRLLAVGGASREGNVSLTECVEPSRTAIVREVKPGEQVYCPIMRDVKVGNDGVTVEYRGVKLLVCCETCAKKWANDPEAYLDAKVLPQLAKMELPARKLEQLFCPVYRDRVVSEKDPFVMYKGKKVYLFNQSAVKKWEENPEKYADAAVLPQLRTTER